MMNYQEQEHHRIDYESILAILEVFCHHLDFLQINNHYIQPIFFDYNLNINF
jgi:hypothetical protein